MARARKRVSDRKAPLLQSGVLPRPVSSLADLAAVLREHEGECTIGVRNISSGFAFAMYHALLTAKPELWQPFETILPNAKAEGSSGVAPHQAATPGSPTPSSSATISTRPMPPTAIRRSCTGLSGKKIGVSSVGSSTFLVLSKMLEGAGMSVEDVQVVAVGNAGHASMAADQIDAYMSSEPATSILVHQCPDVRATRYRNDLWEEYARDTFAHVSVIPLIEDHLAVENIDDIMKVDGISAVLFGPGDYGVSIGAAQEGFTDAMTRRIRDGLRRVCDAAARHNVYVFAIPLELRDPPATMRELFDDGVSGVLFGTDTMHFHMAMNRVKGAFDQTCAATGAVTGEPVPAE